MVIAVEIVRMEEMRAYFASVRAETEMGFSALGGALTGSIDRLDADIIDAKIQHEDEVQAAKLDAFRVGLAS